MVISQMFGIHSGRLLCMLLTNMFRCSLLDDKQIYAIFVQASVALINSIHNLTIMVYIS